MMHPKYGHLKFQVKVYYDGERTPSPRTFESWQSAYAEVRYMANHHAAGVRKIEVIKYREDGFIHQGMLRWDPANGRTI